MPDTLNIVVRAKGPKCRGARCFPGCSHAVIWHSDFKDTERIRPVAPIGYDFSKARLEACRSLSTAKRRSK